MRTQEQIEHKYRTYIKKCAQQREKYEAGYDPYFYAFYYGAAFALGLTLEKSLAEIERDLKRAENKFKFKGR